MRISNLLVIVLFTLSSCKDNSNKLPYYNSADFTPVWEVSDFDSFHKIRNFNLIDQKGKAFTEKNIEGKICVVDFFFTSCPGICPKMTNSMAIIAKEFSKDDNFLILSHSVTPDKDSVSVLADYGEKKGIDYNRWKLLTGKKEEIYNLGRKFYFVEEDLGEKKTDDDFLHTENFVLLDKNRMIRGIYNGLDITAVNQLIADIKILEKEN